MLKDVLNKALEKAESYPAFIETVKRLHAAGKHTGPEQKPAYLNYSELNIARMEKWNKRFSISEDSRTLMESLERPEIWLVINEGWCGDAAHSLPVMHKMAEASPAINFKVVIRDENPELMDNFLTNGARSIPKLIRLDSETLEVLGTWGSAPKEVKELKKDMKAAGQEPQEINKAVQLWYARNRGKAIEQELAAEIVQKTLN